MAAADGGGGAVEVVTLFNHLPEIAARFPGALDAVMSAGAERIAEYGREHHPWQNQSGETEGSIAAEHSGDHEWEVQAGGASVYLEFGTIHMPPFPFLQPAYDAVYPSIEEGLQRLMEKLL